MGSYMRRERAGIEFISEVDRLPHPKLLTVAGTALIENGVVFVDENDQPVIFVEIEGDIIKATIVDSVIGSDGVVRQHTMGEA